MLHCTPDWSSEGAASVVEIDPGRETRCAVAYSQLRPEPQRRRPTAESGLRRADCPEGRHHRTGGVRQADESPAVTAFRARERAHIKCRKLSARAALAPEAPAPAEAEATGVAASARPGTIFPEAWRNAGGPAQVPSAAQASNLLNNPRSGRRRFLLHLAALPTIDDLTLPFSSRCSTRRRSASADRCACTAMSLRHGLGISAVSWRPRGLHALRTPR